MSIGVVVVGVGGFGRETLDVIEAHNSAKPWQELEVLGVADDFPKDRNLEHIATRGYRYIGTVAEAFYANPGARSIVAIGSPFARRNITQALALRGVFPQSVVHPSAIIGSKCRAGDGVVICAGVQVSTNVTLGDYVHLNPGAVIGHDTILEAFVSVNPNATVSGECVVGTGVLVGAGSVVLQGLNVGSDAVVGAAACVTRSVAPETTVVGVPATVHGAPILQETRLPRSEELD